MIVGPTVLMVRNGTGAPATRRLVGEDELVERRAAAAAVLLGPAEGQPAVGAHLPDGVLVDRPVAVFALALQCGPPLGGHEAREVAAQFAAQLFVLGGVIDVHPGPQSATCSSDPSASN